MSTTFWRLQSRQECKLNWHLLALCSILSAGLGVLFAASAGDLYVLMMRTATQYRVSIVSSAVVNWLPFSISLYLIIHSKPRLVYVIIAIHIFLLSAAGHAIACYYLSAGWLVRIFLQFSEYCFIPVLLIVSASRHRISVRKSVFWCLVTIAAVIGMLDALLISPFLEDLMESYKILERYSIHAGLDWRL